MKIYVGSNTLGIVERYGIPLAENHIPIENGIMIETNLDLEKIELVGNYKLVNGELIELIEEEKPTPEPQPSQIEILQGQVKQLTDEKIALAQNVFDLATVVEAIIGTMPAEEATIQ